MLLLQSDHGYCADSTSRSGRKGLRILRLAIDTHLITSHFVLPLLIREPGGLVVEMTDGTREYNAEHWRYMVEVQDAGLPADPTGYR